MKPRYRISVIACALLACVALTSRPVFAQAAEGWQVDLAPLYFWASSTSGNLAINNTRNVPLYLDFADAKDRLAGAFSFHGEARNGRWGALGDVYFIRLSSDVTYTTPILAAPVTGTVKFDETVFNGKVTCQVKPGIPFHLVGGIRTVTVSPNVHLTGPVGGQLADVNPSRTAVAGVGGFIYRPRLAKKVVLLTQADIGGGSVFTWSALAGLEFQIKPWIGLAAGYSALGADTGSVPKSGSAAVNELQFAVTQYGPALSLTFHWAEK